MSIQHKADGITERGIGKLSEEQSERDCCTCEGHKLRHGVRSQLCVQHSPRIFHQSHERQPSRVHLVFCGGIKARRQRARQMAWRGREGVTYLGKQYLLIVSFVKPTESVSHTIAPSEHHFRLRASSRKLRPLNFSKIYFLGSAPVSLS